MTYSPKAPHTPPQLSYTQPRFDSPYSDYYTEPSFSPETCSESKPATSLQNSLLVRLSYVGSQILRKEPSSSEADCLNVGIEAIEAILDPEFRPRQPLDISDSGLFLEDDDQYDSSPASKKISPESPAVKSRVASTGIFYGSGDEDDPSIQQFPPLVTRIESMVEDLQKKYEEVKKLNNLMSEQLEKSIRENQSLQLQNDSLRTDLSFDHAELLFLKLQLKMIETQAASLKKDDKISLLREIKRWKEDWYNIEIGIKERINTYNETPGKKYPRRTASRGRPRLRARLTSAEVIQMDSRLTGATVKISGPSFEDCSKTHDTMFDVTVGGKKRSLDKKLHCQNNKVPVKREFDSENVRYQEDAAHKVDADKGVETIRRSSDLPEQKETEISIGQPNFLKDKTEVSPWKELWIGLMDYTGMLEYED